MAEEVKKIYKSRFQVQPEEVPVVDANLAYKGAIQAIKEGIPEAGTDRWLWSNGVTSEGMKINLINFGYMSHPKVTNVEVLFPEAPAEDEPRYVIYRVFLPKSDFRRYLKDRRKIKWLSGKTNLLWRWWLVKTLERTNLTDIERNIRRGVKEYLGPTVPVLVDVLVQGADR